jgi:hypothetical protein
MSRHIIETLRWECRSSERQLGAEQQQRLSEFLRGPGARALDALFDRLSPQGEVWRIDQLDIDLGEMSASADFATWTRQLERALETRLLRLRQDAVPDESSGQASARPRQAEDGELDNFLYYLQHGRLHWSMPALAHGDMADWLERLARRIGPRLWPALQRLPHADRSLRRLSHITPCHGLQALLAQRHAELAQTLDTLDETLLEPLRAQGQLSAYQIAQVRQAWRVAGLHALWGQGGSTLSIARVQQLLTTLGEALTDQWSGTPMAMLPQGMAVQAAGTSGLMRSVLLGMQMRVAAASPHEAGDTEDRVGKRGGNEETADDGVHRHVLNAAWHESLRQFALLHQHAPVVRSAGLGLSLLQAYLLDYSMAWLADADRIPQDHVAWERVWREALDALAIAPGSTISMGADGSMLDDPSRMHAQSPERPKIKNNRNSDGTVSPADDHPDNEAIYVANAGLVLLANYAPRLFTMLGLLRDNDFVDMAARYRAVHCLAYLSDGHARSEEHAWVLNKLLCGIPIDEPVPPAGELDDVRGTLDGLLLAVIAHWKALGHTTPDGLRQTFLCRIGRLVEHEAYEGQHWRMKVQPISFDMLLDRLPWSFGTIKLPWMKGAIHVDWR